MAKFHFLNDNESLGEWNLQACEEEALKQDDLIHQIAARLLVEVRNLHSKIAHLQCDIDDPKYQYGGGRIHRHAIGCRNAQIDSLTKELKALKAKAAIE